MSISKQYLKTKPACKVTFVVPAEQALAAESVAVLGEFNNWEAAVMKKQKNGSREEKIYLTILKKEFWRMVP